MLSAKKEQNRQNRGIMLQRRKTKIGKGCVITESSIPAPSCTQPRKALLANSCDKFLHMLQGFVVLHINRQFVFVHCRYEHMLEAWVSVLHETTNSFPDEFISKSAIQVCVLARAKYLVFPLCYLTCGLKVGVLKFCH